MSDFRLLLAQNFSPAIVPVLLMAQCCPSSVQQSSLMWVRPVSCGLEQSYVGQSSIIWVINILTVSSFIEFKFALNTNDLKFLCLNATCFRVSKNSSFKH